MSVQMFDKFTIEYAQDTFTTSKVYEPGTNSLMVFVNGILCVPVEHYTEVNPVTVKFVEPLVPGDILIIAPTTVNRVLDIDFKSINIVGNGGNSVFKRYDGVQHLMYNQLYRLNLILKGKSYNYSFTSKYSPMYSTTKVVRTDMQDIISAISDDVINFTIWQNSILANEIAAEEISDTDIPFYAKQWVRYKTELDLLNTIYLAISGKVGSVSKKLGSLQIERSYKLPFLEDLLRETKDKLKPFEKQLMGVKIGAAATKKAGKKTYPIIDRRSF